MRRLLPLGLAVLASLGAVTAGCSQSSGVPESTVDAAIPARDAGPHDAAPSCFTNPHTYLEIINACTDAQAVDKTDDLSPMNLADGGLQPLP